MTRRKITPRTNERVFPNIVEVPMPAGGFGWALRAQTRARRPDQHVAWRADEEPAAPLDLIDLVRGARSVPARKAA